MKHVRLALSLLVLASCAPPQPVVVHVPREPAREPVDEPMRMGAIDVIDAAGTTRTYSTSVVSGEHIGKSTPTDSGGEMATVTSNRLDTNVSGAVTATITDGAGAVNTIVDSSALPTGAATSALQTTGNSSLSSLDTKTLAAGQATMAASSPVVIASNQSAVPVSGTVTVGTLPGTATEDTAVTEDQVGMRILLRRNDALITTTSANSEWTYPSASLSGEMLTLDTEVYGAIQALHDELAPALSLEDAAYAEGTIGLTILGERRDTAHSSAGTDGDNAVFGLTPFGELYTFDEGANATLSTIATSLSSGGNESFATINTSSDTTTTVVSTHAYDEIWLEFEFSTTAAGTLEVWGALTSAGTSTLTDQRGLPLYDVLEGDACSHADGDRLITVAFTSGSGNGVCSVRIPGPPSYLAVRWDQSSGGGASGLAVRTFLR
jgi:hypothetical protein